MSYTPALGPTPFAAGDYPQENYAWHDMPAASCGTRQGQAADCLHTDISIPVTEQPHDVCYTVAFHRRPVLAHDSHRPVSAANSANKASGGDETQLQQHFKRREPGLQRQSLPLTYERRAREGPSEPHIMMASSGRCSIRVAARDVLRNCTTVPPGSNALHACRQHQSPARGTSIATSQATCQVW
jgi:hypothetical protein